MTNPIDPTENAMQEYCTSIGELILWANFIDHQLNLAIILLFVLPDHEMIEPIVAQLDSRMKAELLRKRAKLLEKGVIWRSKITDWIDSVEKINSKRNMVAHHRVAIVNEKIVLHSSQLGKLLDSIPATMRQEAPIGLTDIQTWIASAKAVVSDGDVIIANLTTFRDQVRQQDPA